jgi:hypothetical protein
MVAFMLAALCETAGRAGRYADAVRRRAERVESWAAARRRLPLAAANSGKRPA